ncbi:PKD domain-containing protein [Pontibacter sp. HSC-14F20]|uniref:PKD domain-containing protein n=1 Tax=Pontibacter sp. HSC-14F20 TaxID=2864136 RepID=UPI001C72DCEA|nr:PKD domain-containing protein [Pontibacter sp. HSC-14F20]MBX0332580.1 PKD domain-containing protein [Pontibacter sp. HSC-14F20]
MKRYLYTSKSVIFTLLLICIACNKEEDAVTPDIPTTPIAPIAHAGNDTTMYRPYKEYVLNGGASTDPDSNIVSYQWRLMAGPSAVNIKQQHFSDVKAYASELTMPGNYDFELTVTDADKLTAKDTVTVTIIVPTEVPVCSDPKEFIFKDLIWDYSWIMEIDIYNFYSNLPANSQIQKIYIKRDNSEEWEPAVYLAESSGYTLHTWDYGNGILVIFPSENNMGDDTPDVKIEYCN